MIHKGIINEKELKRLNYNLNDLIEQLRVKDVMSISDVHYAIIETNGELSVMLKPPQTQPAARGYEHQTGKPRILLRYHT